MSKIITYTCPNCNGQILHDESSKDDYEICSFCGTEHSISALKGSADISGAASGDPVVSSGAAAVEYIDQAESALAYVENFFENYDWDTFCNNTMLTIPAIDRVVEKMLVKSAANPATWELQFTSVVTPVGRKITGLKKLEEKFFEEYVNKDDLADSFVYFDLYSKIVKKVVAGGEALTKKLASAIKYHKKYKGAEATSKQMTAQLEAFEAVLKKLKPVAEFKDMPGYNKAVEAKQKKVSNALAEKGIDAEAVYRDAVTAHEVGGDLRHALTMFRSIAGYKDASEHAQKIDSWFEFEMKDGTFVTLGKKYYIMRTSSSASTEFSVANPTGAAPAPTVKTSSLYEIVDAKQSKTACVTGITSVIAHYGGTMVYMKKGTEICMYNSTTNAETSLLTVARKGDLKFIAFADNKLFALRKLEAAQKVEEKKGCFASLFGKKKPAEVVVVNRNNFALVTINPENGKITTVVPELVDIQETFGEEIFYNKVRQDGAIEKDEMYAYNYVTGENRKVLSTDTEIVDVIDGNVIYFVWTPNDYNKNLYALNLATKVTTLLAANVYDYYAGIEGRAYYYVGNRDRAALYSINVDGSDKMQIRSNASFFGKKPLYRNGWLYVTVGERRSYNYALAKLRPNGKDFTLLCLRFAELIDIRDGYVYYIDRDDNLCAVREDGSDRKQIIGALEGFVYLADNGIYLLRREIVDENNGKYVYSNSLYRVDYDGAGLTKVAFNVVNAAANESDKNELYIYKTARTTYRIETPTDKDNYATTYETRTIKTIGVYNIAEDSFTDIAVFGTKDLSANGSFEFKAGCFKKVKKDVIVTEVRSKKTFKRKGKASAGDTAVEQAAEAIITDPAVQTRISK